MTRWGIAASVALTALCGLAAPARAQVDILDIITLLGGKEELKSPGVSAFGERPESKQPEGTVSENRLKPRAFHTPLEARWEKAEKGFGMLEEHPFLWRPESMVPRVPGPAEDLFPSRPREPSRLLEPIPGLALPPAPGSGRGPAPPGSVRSSDEEDDDPGPAGGLTLDAAIERLVHCNRDLLAKYHEIPQADADILTAGLRENPQLFWDAGDIPYGRFSNQPGTRSFPMTIVYAVDLTGRRRARVRVARVVKKVLEARYQNEVRVKVNALQSAFVEALAARASGRAARAMIDDHDRLIRAAADRGGGEAVRKLSVERELAEMAGEDADDRLRGARRTIAALLDLPRESADSLELHGRLRVDGPPLPTTEALVQIALMARPDLLAQRLSVQQSMATAKLEEARTIRDTYILYQPWGYEVGNVNGSDHAANTWGLGLFVPIPLFDRNQGNIRRARLDVDKVRMELGHVERQTAEEVQDAAESYAKTLKAVTRLGRVILPEARRSRDNERARFLSGAGDVDSFMSAARAANAVARYHREAVVQHRRSALQLNTAVGQRIVP